ncbi:MAG: hypothetical protein WC683_01930 [bacterium]
MALVYGSCPTEIAYFKQLEAERIALVGPTCEYYSLNRGKHVDPLYGEPDNDPLYGGMDPRGTPQHHPTSWNFSPDVAGGEAPLTFQCAIEYQEADQRQPSARAEGKQVEYDATLYVAVLHWEAAVAGRSFAARVPKEGDVTYVFGLWWDVVNAGSSGNVLDTASVVGWKLLLKRRSQFVPERKVG